MPIITVEKPLKDKLGDEAVDSLVRLINQTQSDQKAEVVELVGEKFEHRLGEEIGKVSLVISETEKRLDNRVTEEIGNVRVEAARNHASLIKWMFIFWVGQVAALLGILFAFFK